MDTKTKIIENKQKKLNVHIEESECENIKYITIKISGVFRNWKWLEAKIKSYCTGEVELQNCDINDLFNLRFFNFWVHQADYLTKVVNKTLIHLDFSNCKNKKMPNDVLRGLYNIASIKFGANLKSIGEASFSNLQNCRCVSMPISAKVATSAMLLMGESYKLPQVRAVFGEFSFDLFKDEPSNVVYRGKFDNFKPFIKNALTVEEEFAKQVYL